MKIAAELPGDKMLAEYFRGETAKLADACLIDVESLADWERRRPKYQEQLFDMLGLNPLPEKSDLKATITGIIEREDFTVEKLHFQSLPGLYVTANLYLPKNVSAPVPTILYLCGHAKVFTNGVSLGNKTAYQHHGIWFARNGYACLIIDTLQLGEIEGIHHGTHNKGMWWWNSRGYTPAGVEAWNNIRALDYLETRPEVDKDKIGATGRSGGGAYSWVIGALDDRIKVSAPVAGITDLENYVVDGAVEGHCDCMFHVNTYRWDYPLVAALMAPRPLLFCNSDKDRIFPLEGVLRTHAKVREIYRLYGATTNFGLLITEGNHEDTQDLQVPVFRWFNRFLKNENPKIEMAALKMIEPKDLKVFETLPEDSINARIHETFVPAGEVKEPGALRDALREKVFAGWPTQDSFAPTKLAFQRAAQGMEFAAYDFESQAGVNLRFYVLRPTGRSEGKIEMHVLDEPGWKDWLAAAAFDFPQELQVETEIAGVVANAALGSELRDRIRVGTSTYIFFAPRGIGLSAWSGSEKERTHIRRRFMLLGQTLDGMRVWDIRRAIRSARELNLSQPLDLHGKGVMAANCMLASLFEADAVLAGAKQTFSHPAAQPDYLNLLRVSDFK